MAALKGGRLELRCELWPKSISSAIEENEIQIYCSLSSNPVEAFGIYDLDYFSSIAHSELNLALRKNSRLRYCSVLLSSIRRFSKSTKFIVPYVVIG